MSKKDTLSFDTAFVNEKSGFKVIVHFLAADLPILSQQRSRGHGIASPSLNTYSRKNTEPLETAPYSADVTT